jgi:hypothetical protein
MLSPYARAHRDPIWRNTRRARALTGIPLSTHPTSTIAVDIAALLISRRGRRAGLALREKRKHSMPMVETSLRHRETTSGRDVE